MGWNCHFHKYGCLFIGSFCTTYKYFRLYLNIDSRFRVILNYVWNWSKRYYINAKLADEVYWTYMLFSKLCKIVSLSNSGIAILLLKSDIKDDDRDPVEQYYWYISQPSMRIKDFIKKDCIINQFIEIHMMSHNTIFILCWKEKGGSVVAQRLPLSIFGTIMITLSYLEKNT